MLHTTRWATAATVVSIGLPGISTAAIHNVPADYPTIQACIDAAASGVDECVVAPGTYHETINFLGKAITLRSSGGRDVTTIDATGLGGSVVTCASGEGPGTVLDGFTITGGTGTDPYGYAYTFGGGMYNWGGSPRVTRCTFCGNAASDTGGGMYNGGGSPSVTNCTFSGNTAGYGGGGMYNLNSNPTVTNCTFCGNTATSSEGGGMSNDYGSPTVTNCTFTGNTAASLGGGISNSYGSPTVTNCTFSGNTGGGSGGISNLYGSPAVSNCTFTGNTTAGSGGGMSNFYGSPLVTNCTFTGNTAASSGGGMSNHYGSPLVTNCTFNGNTATSSVGGGMSNYYGSPNVANCTFSGNRGDFGGGMFVVASGPRVTDCAFIGNTATFQGGGMYNSGRPVMTNCTFSANTANESGGAMYNDYFSNPGLNNCILRGDSPSEIANCSSYDSLIRFSDVQGGLPVGAVDGGGNIDLDPMFVRPPNPGPDGTWDGVDDDYGDLRLQAGSPCIDAGDPAFVAQPAETDLDGHTRVLCARVDMGAYEFGVGDYDCDQSVDLTDFANWSACMTGPPDVRELALAALTGPAVQSAIDNRQLAIGCGAFDFDADGDVDLLDFDAFQMIFGP